MKPTLQTIGLGRTSALSRPRGFALIVTLSLMILLTVIAVGLLSLSSISLRASSQAAAMADARANAKLALMLAIGELQKTTGPDKAVTAPSESIAATPQKPNLTGVWDSWDLDVRSSSLDYAGPKTQKSQGEGNPGFKGWLVSAASPDDAQDRSYAESAFSGESIEMVGEGSLGKGAGSADKARAGKVPLTRGSKKTGNFAWHISDEAVKARINTYRDTNGTLTLAQKRALLAGHRPDVTVMENTQKSKLGFLPDDVQNYQKALATTGKIVSLNQAELFDNTPTIKTFRNDVTPYSLGLLTNVREGGLKQDLTSLFEMTTNGASGTTGLPAEFNGRKLYQTNVYSGGSAVTGVSDPYWTALAGYYNSYKELLNPETSPKLYKAPAQDIQLTLVQPQQYAPAPVIAKVELLFSFLVRDKHGPWMTDAAGSGSPYMGHLLYVPIITLHNPYNVNLQFDRMKVGMIDVPMGFTFYVNGVAQNNMAPLSSLYYQGTVKKEFWMELGDWASASATSTTAPIVMKPGQTMVFGPYITATETFGVNGSISSFDYNNNRTGTEAAPVKSQRGFAGPHMGFDVDWLKGTVLYLKPTDKVAIDFKPIVPSGVTTFQVKATLTSKNVTKAYGGLNFSYGSQATLDKVLPGTFRYPKTDGILASAMYASNVMPNASISTAKAFGLFSAYAHTSNGGVDGTGSRVVVAGAKTSLPDGRIAGKPLLHNNAARVVISSDLTREKPGAQSHELNLVQLNGSTDDAFSIASDFRTNCLQNYKQVAGKSIKSGGYLEIPSGPLQAIADFRRSNVLASPFLPAMVQPIGNSYASPLMDTNTVLQSGVTSYALMDHSVLANHALYDRTYFSTFAGVAGRSAVDGFNDFMNGGKPLQSQLFQAYQPSGRTIESIKSELFASNGKPTAAAYKLAAQYQMVKGPFNVNSTRVQAWKAVLSSMNHSGMLTLWAKTGNLDTGMKSNGVPIPAMTLHNGTSTSGTFTVANIDDKAGNEWNGYRELNDADIEKLAIEIVKQVRLRGPFLSMSEFVNRRIGGNSELTRSGALQNAIDDSKLNDTVFAAQIPVAVGDVSNSNLYGFKTPEAATGNPAAGAPGWLSQADILKILEPAATVRSDTFVIRTCGEATDSNGKVVARAYMEAVVQRIPEYVNPADPAAARVPNPNAPGTSSDPLTPQITSTENVTFGRKFVMVSCKWLSQNEI
ncbi:MAG: hypothetical protein ABIT37_12980 [Luteolibacter sp.]